MRLLYYTILISSVILNECIYGQFVLPPTNLDEYDAYGSLLAINEYLSILAQNDEECFSIITYPFTNRSTNCTLRYNTKEDNVSSLTRFVYNVAIGAKQNASQLIFSYIDENWRRDVFLTIVFLNFTTTGCVELVNRTRVNMTDLKMQENGLVGMDPGGKWAYAIGTYYIVCVDVETSENWQLNTEELLNNETNFGNLFFPKAFVVTEDQYIFLVGQRFTNFQFLPYLLVINFLPASNITLFSSTELSKFNFGPLSVDITRYSSMSISLLDQIQQCIIGIPHLDMIIILSWDEKNVSKNPLIVHNYISSESGIYFGKSVALLDNNTFAVLAHMLPTLPWSTSQVQIYSFHDEESINRPLIVYPNNQQIILSLNSISPPHSILTLVSWKSHIGLVFDAGVALLLSASPPGYYSAQINDSVSGMDMYISLPCIPGTARNTTSFGPCFLCSPKTKNNGTSGINCETCTIDDSLLCLRGSSVEIPLINVTNYNQAVPYPNPPDLVVFDDILLENIFSFTTDSPHCLVRSPLFWASLAIGLGFIILIVMYILIYFPRYKSHRMFLKTLLRHMDLIGEGEVWFGGLLTFAIIVLLVFTCKFSVSFTRLYPTDPVSSDTETSVSCDSNMPNAKFTSVLQLLSIPQHGEEKRIFTMLDEQEITLTAHFVSTAFLCDHVTLKENLDRGQQVPSNNCNCSYDKEISILSVSTQLPQHLITMQFDLMGPYFIGGLRICLSGLSNIEDDGKYTLQELHFCQLFYTDNETLTINPTINVKMTKVINRTVGYTVNDAMSFGGIWIPTLTVSTLSDVLLFGESGEYIRYLSDRVTLVVDITESEFFMKNTQEPIARHNEIILHTILFAIVFLELFGLFFLLAKLTIVPFAKFIRRRFFPNKDQLVHKNEEQKQLPQFPIDQSPKNGNIIKKRIADHNDDIIRTML